MSRWPTVKMGSVLRLDLNKVPIDPACTYKMVGVLSYGRGLFERSEICNGETSYSYFLRLNASHVVMSQLFGWEGALALSDKRFSGSYVSPQFPTFVVDESRAERGYIGWLIRRPQLWAELGGRAKGLGDRRRTLNPDALLQCDVPMPPVDLQRTIASRLDAIEKASNAADASWNAIERDADAVLAREFAHLIDCAPRRPLGEVAPLTRRPVDLQPGQRYAEVGARSFGKGLFTKPEFDADAATWQKPVWIKSGDLVLSNIKAWEGAIAVAEDQHDGCIASHRYLTCVPDQAIASAAFLSYFLLTPEGLDAVGLASPGTADRNRTTNPKALQAIPVPLPSPSRQKSFADLQAKIKALKEAQAGQREQLDQLQQRALEDAFS